MVPGRDDPPRETDREREREGESRGVLTILPNRPGHVCLVFESLGRSLFDYLKQNDYRPFPFVMVLELVKQMLDAVHFLHSMDLIHTDLKPENVLSLSVDGEHTLENDHGDKVLVPASTRIKREERRSARVARKHTQAR
jgi:hypothetical protein